MGRRRKWRTRFFESGVLVVDKPEGPTSHDVVAKLRGRFGPAKIGHSGTLDPFATGVLVVAFNQATKLSDLLGAGGKKYRAGLVLGRCTDTGDLAGSETGTAPVPELDRATVEQALAVMIGPRMQSPPAYSAAKHEGRPLYSYARDGKIVEKPPRPITIYDAALLDLRPGEIDFEMHCSRGAYIRTLGEDLAKDLGSVGHLQSLRRTASLPFGQDEAIGLEQALELTPEELARRLISMSEALGRCGLPAVTVDDDGAWRLRQGQGLPSETLLPQGLALDKAQGPFRVLEHNGTLIAVLRWLEPDEPRRDRDYEVIRVFPGDMDSPNALTSASAQGAE